MQTCRITVLDTPMHALTRSSPKNTHVLTSLRCEFDPRVWTFVWLLANRLRHQQLKDAPLQAQGCIRISSASGQEDCHSEAFACTLHSAHNLQHTTS